MNPVPSSAPHTPFWHDARWRGWFAQIVLLTVVGAGLAWMVHNTIENLNARGIAYGFGFLGREAGFDVLFSLIPFSPADTYGRTFIVGLLNTLLVSALSIVLATMLGLLVGVARLSGNWLISRLALAYVEIFRNIPLLLQIIFWYGAVLATLPGPRQSLVWNGWVFLNNRGLYVPWPELGPGFAWVWAALALALALAWVLGRWARARQDRTGQSLPVVWMQLGLVVLLPATAFLAAGSPLGWSIPELAGFNFQHGQKLIPELVALTLGLSLYTSASIADLVRAGIQAVPKGQSEAANSLGLRPGRVMNRVILPQAMRVTVPPLTSQYLNVVKNSSLATAVGYPDLVSLVAGTTLNQTGQAVEIIAMTMAVYLTISLLISLLMNLYNRTTRLRER